MNIGEEKSVAMLAQASRKSLCFFLPLSGTVKRCSTPFILTFAMARVRYPLQTLEAPSHDMLQQHPPDVEKPGESCSRAATHCGSGNDLDARIRIAVELMQATSSNASRQVSSAVACALGRLVSASTPKNARPHLQHSNRDPKQQRAAPHAPPDHHKAVGKTLADGQAAVQPPGILAPKPRWNRRLVTKRRCSGECCDFAMAPAHVCRPMVQTASTILVRQQNSKADHPLPTFADGKEHPVVLDVLPPIRTDVSFPMQHDTLCAECGEIGANTVCQDCHEQVHVWCTRTFRNRALCLDCWNHAQWRRFLTASECSKVDTDVPFCDRGGCSPSNDACASGRVAGDVSASGAGTWQVWSPRKLEVCDSLATPLASETAYFACHQVLNKLKTHFDTMAAKLELLSAMDGARPQAEAEKCSGVIAAASKDIKSSAAEAEIPSSVSDPVTFSEFSACSAVVSGLAVARLSSPVNSGNALAFVTPSDAVLGRCANLPGAVSSCAGPSADGLSATRSLRQEARLDSSQRWSEAPSPCHTNVF